MCNHLLVSLDFMAKSPTALLISTPDWQDVPSFSTWVLCLCSSFSDVTTKALGISTLSPEWLVVTVSTLCCEDEVSTSPVNDSPDGSTAPIFIQLKVSDVNSEISEGCLAVSSTVTEGCFPCLLDWINWSNFGSNWEASFCCSWNISSADNLDNFATFSWCIAGASGPVMTKLLPPVTQSSRMKQCPCSRT